MSAMAELRSATWPSHQRLEKRLDVKSRFSDRVAYRQHLEKMWGFCSAIERQLGAHVFGEALADYENRRKIPLLSSDLMALGLDSHALGQLPHCETVPDCVDASAAFGCVYVIEGATLGGRTLLPLVQGRLGLTSGTAFLASYGTEVGTMWRTFGVALEAWCEGPQRRFRATQAAVATFTSLDGWLCGIHDG